MVIIGVGLGTNFGKKGEESGNVQKVLEIKIDFDEDTLIYLVEQSGNACHKNTKTCFQRDLI